MAEPQPSKLVTRVRLPSPALKLLFSARGAHDVLRSVDRDGEATLRPLAGPEWGVSGSTGGGARGVALDELVLEVEQRRHEIARPAGTTLSDAIPTAPACRPLAAAGEAGPPIEL
jgi:hypothetical protein